MSEFLSKSFDLTLKHYKISAKALAEESGASASQISEFRNGKRNLSTIQLERVMVAMDTIAPGSRHHFCMLMSGENPVALEEQVKSLNSKQLAALLNSVADRLAAAQTRELVGTLT